MDYASAKELCFSRGDVPWFYGTNSLTELDQWGCKTLTPADCPNCFASPKEALLNAIAQRADKPVHTGGWLGEQIFVGDIKDICPGSYLTPGGKCAPIVRADWNPGKYFTQVGIAIAQGAAFLASAGALTPLTAAAFYGQQFYSALTQSGALKMGLDLGGIFGGVANAIGGISSGNYWQALQGGFGAASAAFAPSPMMAPMPASMPLYGPVYSPPPVAAPAPPVVAQPVGAFGVAARAITAVTAPILAKIAVKLGLRARPSLTRAMDMVRKAAKLLQSPEAVAAALGITVAELASLITASNARKRRRMNPANSKALRRAARRIKSFHRLCTHTDVLRGRGRGSRRVASCGTCKKSPCRC